MADDFDDDDDEFVDPWEIGMDEQCSCENYFVNCDASNSWCWWHDEWREAVARYDAAAKSHREAGDGR